MPDLAITRVAVGRDGDWDARFLAGLEHFARAGAPVEYALVDMLAADWLDQVAPFDIVIWNPLWMTAASTSFMKEKVHFLETYLGKTVVPNFATAWHYESKVGQSYLLEHLDVPRPHTVASFSADDAEERLDVETYPLVFKESSGAGSQGVSLARDRREAERKVQDVLAQSYWDRFRAAAPGSPWRRAWSVAGTRWFRSKVRDTLMGRPRVHPVYWQEFVPGNEGDLRIVATGDRFVQWFWRRNRPGDFRASGSGLIHYDPPPEDVVRYCLDLNRRCGFDSIGYDILRRPDGRFVVSELTYTYPPQYCHAAPGHYRLERDGELRLVEGHVWPQELWVEWALERAGALPPS